MATTEQTKLLSAIVGSHDRDTIINQFLRVLVETKKIPLAVFWMFPKTLETGRPELEKEVVAAYHYPSLQAITTKSVDCTSLIRTVEGVGPVFFASDDPTISQFQKAIPNLRLDMNFLYVEDYGYIQLLLNKKAFSLLGGDNNVFTADEKTALPLYIELLRQKLEMANYRSQIANSTPTFDQDEHVATHIPNPAHQSKLLSTVSHEILNPLNTIKGYTTLLSDKTADPTQADYLNIIEEQRAQLESIVKKILNNTDLRIKEKEIREQVFDLNEVFYDLRLKFQTQAQRKGIGFNLFIDERLDYGLLGPKELFADALTFLVENAVRYSLRGRVSVSAQIEGIAEEKISIAFYVKESGGAFTKIDVNGLLNFFKPEASKDSRSHDIMGLGLSLARYYIKCMGAELMFQKESEDSTFFVFKMDFSIVKSKLVVKRADSMIPNKDITRTIKILLVEDQIVQHTIFKHAFKDWLPYTAESGKEALEILKSHPDISIVLMDINMDGMDGIATTVKIRQELMSNVPIIAYTGERIENRLEDCLNAGMNAFVTKPWDELPLLLTIEKVLNRNDILIPETELSKAGSLEGFRALVIDHLDKILNITSRTLQDAGCQVDVLNGFNGVTEMLRLNNYDFILTDFVGSDSDLFKIVKSIQLMGLKTKVIAYVADNAPDIHTRCLAMGLKGPLLKSYASHRSLSFNIIDLLESKSLAYNSKLYNFKLLGDIDEQMQTELVELFIGETNKYLQVLLNHLNDGNFNRVSIIAHTLKSSCGQFNIKAVVNDLERIEKHQKFGVSEVEVIFLINKVVVLLNRAMQEMAADFNLKYPLD